MPARKLAVYLPAQIVGGIAGAVLPNAMFATPTAILTTDRASSATFLAEIVATAGLVLLIMGLSRTSPPAPVIALTIVLFPPGPTARESVRRVERPDWLDGSHRSDR